MRDLGDSRLHENSGSGDECCAWSGEQALWCRLQYGLNCRDVRRVAQADLVEDIIVALAAERRQAIDHDPRYAKLTAAQHGGQMAFPFGKGICTIAQPPENQGYVRHPARGADALST